MPLPFGRYQIAYARTAQRLVAEDAPCENEAQLGFSGLCRDQFLCKGSLLTLFGFRVPSMLRDVVDLEQDKSNVWGYQ
jgi:hypothetical protein